MTQTHKAEFKGQSLVHGDVVYKGCDQVGRLCRVLKQGTLDIYRDSKIAGTVKDVSKRAEMQLSENDRGFRYVKYKPNPFAKEKQ